MPATLSHAHFPFRKVTPRQADICLAANARALHPLFARAGLTRAALTQFATLAGSKNFLDVAAGYAALDSRASDVLTSLCPATPKPKPTVRAPSPTCWLSASMGFAVS